MRSLTAAYRTKINFFVKPTLFLSVEFHLSLLPSQPCVLATHKHPSSTCLFPLLLRLPLHLPDKLPVTPQNAPQVSLPVGRISWLFRQAQRLSPLRPHTLGSNSVFTLCDDCSGNTVHTCASSAAVSSSQVRTRLCSYGYLHGLAQCPAHSGCK